MGDMIHRIVNGLHILESNGFVNVYTEKEYSHLTWWDTVKLKYNL